jgi:hypothetical protein
MVWQRTQRDLLGSSRVGEDMVYIYDDICMNMDSVLSAWQLPISLNWIWVSLNSIDSSTLRVTYESCRNLPLGPPQDASIQSTCIADYSILPLTSIP